MQKFRRFGCWCESLVGLLCTKAWGDRQALTRSWARAVVCRSGGQLAEHRFGGDDRLQAMHPLILAWRLIAVRCRGCLVLQQDFDV